MTFEEALLKSCADQFFTSAPSHSVTDQNGKTEHYYAPSPALALARQLFDAKKNEIMALVMEKLDLDVVAEKLSKSVLEALTTNPPMTSWGHDPHRALRERIQEAIVNKVANDMAEDVKKKMGSSLDAQSFIQPIQPKDR